MKKEYAFRLKSSSSPNKAILWDRKRYCRITVRRDSETLIHSFHGKSPTVELLTNNLDLDELRSRSIAIKVSMLIPRYLAKNPDRPLSQASLYGHIRRFF